MTAGVAPALLIHRRASIPCVSRHIMSQSGQDSRPAWQEALPVLSGLRLTLREPVLRDAAALRDLLAAPDAPFFGIEETIDLRAVSDFIERSHGDRQFGRGFLYLVTLTAAHEVVGCCSVRAMDAMFETAEWTGTLAPWARGTGLFLEGARLVGGFAFEVAGTHRLECRVPLHSGRAHGALRKLGAVQEGVLRRSRRVSDDYRDEMLWSILKEDWTRRLAALAAERVH
jgi:RimJ/RimL family protein N-acetyltransferase